MEAVWLREALFGGMSAAALRLGTALTRGWFWVRVRGCAILYRCNTIDVLDLKQILAVAKLGSVYIGPPQYIEHKGNATYFYIVRCANTCGELEDTRAAVLRFSTDSDGELVKPRANRVRGLSATQVDDNKANLVWFYEPLGQGSVPVRFNIYSDGGTGDINSDSPVGQITYAGRRFYRFGGDISGMGEIQFAVKVEDTGGNHSAAASVGIQIHRQVCESAEVIYVE